jgi:hypothetical protein
LEPEAWDRKLVSSSFDTDLDLSVSA